MKTVSVPVTLPVISAQALVTKDGDATIVGKKKASRDADHAQGDLEKVGGDKAEVDMIKAGSGGMAVGSGGIVIQGEELV